MEELCSGLFHWGYSTCRFHSRHGESNWTSPKVGSKIDVQFIEKNTVLFRIENSSMRDRVIKRKYWHIADVPLVVSMWTPESALHPPDLSAMPLWVDIRGVPNDLYSHKGLKCLSKAVGGFVKLHPHTERCVRLDVARILIEVDLHSPLVEKISFKDKQESMKELEVTFPWLPNGCNICQKWGHKGVECKEKGIVILQNSVEETVSKSLLRYQECIQTLSKKQRMELKS